MVSIDQLQRLPRRFCRYLARNLAGEQNFEEARRWTERAVAQGLQDAKADLAALPTAMGPDAAQSTEETARAAGD